MSVRAGIFCCSVSPHTSHISRTTAILPSNRRRRFVVYYNKVVYMCVPSSQVRWGIRETQNQARFQNHLYICAYIYITYLCIPFCNMVALHSIPWHIVTRNNRSSYTRNPYVRLHNFASQTCILKIYYVYQCSIDSILANSTYLQTNLLYPLCLSMKTTRNITKIA